MAEYIKRADAMKICQEYSSHCFISNDASGQDIADRIEDDIVKLPTADVVEVVRCKDCMYCTKAVSIENTYFCVVGSNATDTTLDNFCSYGERSDT